NTRNRTSMACEAINQAASLPLIGQPGAPVESRVHRAAPFACGQWFSLVRFFLQWGKHAKLLQHAEIIPNAPVFDNFAIDQAHNVDQSHGDVSASRWNAQKLPLMGAPVGLAADDLVPFGNHVLNRHDTIREGGPEHGAKVFNALP